jgi:hypothetical protein
MPDQANRSMDEIHGENGGIIPFFLMWYSKPTLTSDSHRRRSMFRSAVNDSRTAEGMMRNKSF